MCPCQCKCVIVWFPGTHDNSKLTFFTENYPQALKNSRISVSAFVLTMLWIPTTLATATALATTGFLFLCTKRQYRLLGVILGTARVNLHLPVVTMQ